MSTSVEIEVESEDKCASCGQDMKASKPEISKDAMLAELKALLNNNNENGMADRQMKIDELMSKIQELGGDD